MKSMIKFWSAGEKSVGQAPVIHDWYVTAYEPVRNLKNENIGILAVGMLEQKFVDMRTEALFIFLGITLFGMGLSILIANFSSRSVVKPDRESPQGIRSDFPGGFFCPG